MEMVAIKTLAAVEGITTLAAVDKVKRVEA
jgi:hypothetical protein